MINSRKTNRSNSRRKMPKLKKSFSVNPSKVLLKSSKKWFKDLNLWLGCHLMSNHILVKNMEKYMLAPIISKKSF